MATPWQTAAAEKKITATKVAVAEARAPHVGTDAADLAQAKRERRQARNRANA